MNVIDANRETGFEAADTKPSRLWWLISGIWMIAFSLVVIFVLSAEYARYERPESLLIPTSEQVNAQASEHS